MKSILVFDTPERCGFCPVKKEINGTYDYCFDGRRLPIETLVSYNRLKDCPLRPLPNEREVNMTKQNEYEVAVNEGWNACIDEILAE